jgi:hypothetical protein
MKEKALLLIYSIMYSEAFHFIFVRENEENAVAAAAAGLEIGSALLITSGIFIIMTAA